MTIEYKQLEWVLYKAKTRFNILSLQKRWKQFGFYYKLILSAFPCLDISGPDSIQEDLYLIPTQLVENVTSFDSHVFVLKIIFTYYSFKIQRPHIFFNLCLFRYVQGLVNEVQRAEIFITRVAFGYALLCFFKFKCLMSGIIRTNLNKQIHPPKK